MNELQDTLLSLAEVAVALAGFSAVVIALRQSGDGKWPRSVADRFHGMVVHSVFAVAFSLLPLLLDVLVQDPVTTLQICCVVLGIQILGHSISVMAFKSSGSWARISLGIGVLLGLLQFSVFTEWAVLREGQIYTVGIVWHILQAGLLFVMLVWIPASEQIDDI